MYESIFAAVCIALGISSMKSTIEFTRIWQTQTKLTPLVGKREHRWISTVYVIYDRERQRELYNNNNKITIAEIYNSCFFWGVEGRQNAKREKINVELPRKLALLASYEKGGMQKAELNEWVLYTVAIVATF